MRQQRQRVGRPALAYMAAAACRTVLGQQQRSHRLLKGGREQRVRVLALGLLTDQLDG